MSGDHCTMAGTFKRFRFLGNICHIWLSPGIPCPIGGSVCHDKDFNNLWETWACFPRTPHLRKACRQSRLRTTFSTVLTTAPNHAILDSSPWGAAERAEFHCRSNSHLKERRTATSRDLGVEELVSNDLEWVRSEDFDAWHTGKFPPQGDTVPCHKEEQECDRTARKWSQKCTASSILACSTLCCASKHAPFHHGWQLLGA